jgi:gliding motility-associated-like protein
LVNGTISSWLWDFGTSSGTGASPQNIFTNSGPQTVSLSVTGSNGCKASVSSTVMVHPKPSSVFQINTGCVNSQTVLNNISSISGGNIQSFQWNYGDGHTGQTFNGANTYSAAGYYPVQLIATSDFGCKDTSIDTIRIYPLPVANFYAPNVCMGNPTLFNDLSSAVSDSLISWHWDFGDGQTATQPNPSHIFADDTIYSVTLTVQNEGQCIRSITKNTLILALPKVGFTYTHPCMGSPVQFQDTSFLAGQSIMSWNWNMGDNTHSTISAPLHTYQQYGSVLVSLIVKASNGCSDSVTVPIVVNQLPEASFSANEVCEQAPLVVTNNSYLAGGGIDATLWLWGDNTTDTIFTPIHYYTDYGDYNVQLVVTGSNGCVNDTSVMVRIHDNPVAAFTHSNACQLAPITFNNNASVFNDTIQTSSWVFGDGNASSQFDAVNNYISYGVYNVVLTVNSGFGCIDSVSLPVTIAPKPQAYFHSENVCFQQPMYFFDSSLVSIGSIISHQWNFGDGTTATDINPVHLFNSTGNQTISLVVTTINQCMDTLQRIFRVYELPEAQFISDINEGCQPLWVQYSDSSQANEGNIIKWIWNFDNTYSDYTATPPATLYDQAGLFSPALIVQTDLGCKDTLMIQDYIHVFPKPEAGFSTEPSVTTILHPVVDIIDQSWGATEWLYDFNDSTTSTDQNPVHWYQRPAQYMIMQYITSADGCKDTTFAYLEIKNDFTCYIPNSFTPNGDGINETWNASGIGISDFIIQVFNRWGQLVFSSDQIGKGWDGNYMGQKAKQDVYIYKAAIRDIFNNQHVYTGNVNLIR